MANEIPNETVQAPVIQFNNHQYITDGQYDPQLINVPCGINALVDPYQWWAIPVKNDGIMSILQLAPAINGNVDQPTPDSISCIRIRDKYNPGYTWWAICSLNDYYAACAACCGDTPDPIPDPTLPVIVPCQLICNSTNDEGQYISVFGYPENEGEYTAYGQYNGEELSTQTAATMQLLLIALNIHWTGIGSPSTNFEWTASGGVLTATGGNEGDSICVLITSQVPSP